MHEDMRETNEGVSVESIKSLKNLKESLADPAYKEIYELLLENKNIKRLAKSENGETIVRAFFRIGGNIIGVEKQLSGNIKVYDYITNNLCQIGGSEVNELKKYAHDFVLEQDLSGESGMKGFLHILPMS